MITFRRLEPGIDGRKKYEKIVIPRIRSKELSTEKLKRILNESSLIHQLFVNQYSGKEVSDKCGRKRRKKWTHKRKSRVVSKQDSIKSGCAKVPASGLERPAKHHQVLTHNQKSCISVRRYMGKRKLGAYVRSGVGIRGFLGCKGLDSTDSGAQRACIKGKVPISKSGAIRSVGIGGFSWLPRSLWNLSSNEKSTEAKTS